MLRKELPDPVLREEQTPPHQSCRPPPLLGGVEQVGEAAGDLRREAALEPAGSAPGGPGPNGTPRGKAALWEDTAALQEPPQQLSREELEQIPALRAARWEEEAPRALHQERPLHTLKNGGGEEHPLEETLTLLNAPGGPGPNGTPRGKAALWEDTAAGLWEEAGGAAGASAFWEKKETSVVRKAEADGSSPRGGTPAPPVELTLSPGEVSSERSTERPLSRSERARTTLGGLYDGAAFWEMGKAGPEAEAVQEDNTPAPQEHPPTPRASSPAPPQGEHPISLAPAAPSPQEHPRAESARMRGRAVKEAWHRSQAVLFGLPANGSPAPSNRSIGGPKKKMDPTHPLSRSEAWHRKWEAWHRSQAAATRPALWDSWHRSGLGELPPNGTAHLSAVGALRPPLSAVADLSAVAAHFSDDGAVDPTAAALREEAFVGGENVELEESPVGGAEVESPQEQALQESPHEVESPQERRDGQPLQEGPLLQQRLRRIQMQGVELQATVGVVLEEAERTGRLVPRGFHKASDRCRHASYQSWCRQQHVAGRWPKEVPHAGGPRSPPRTPTHSSENPKNGADRTTGPERERSERATGSERGRRSQREKTLRSPPTQFLLPTAAPLGPRSPRPSGVDVGAARAALAARARPRSSDDSSGSAAAPGGARTLLPLKIDFAALARTAMNAIPPTSPSSGLCDDVEGDVERDFDVFRRRSKGTDLSLGGNVFKNIIKEFFCR